MDCITSCICAAGIPEATNAPTIDPAEVPATRGNVYPASCSTLTAPTRAIPFTPPPSSTRSAFNDSSATTLTTS